MPLPQTFEKRFLELEREVRKLRSRSAFTNTGLSVAAPKVTAVDGELRADSYVPGETGWRLTEAGDAEFNDLTLRGGIIGNDALANPAMPAGIAGIAGSFALTTTGTTPLVTRPVTVPDGFDTLHFNTTVRVNGVNSTGALDYLMARVKVVAPAGVVGLGQGIGLPVAAGLNGFNMSPMVGIVDNLTPGQVVTFYAEGWTGSAGWAANGNNYAELMGTLTWYR